MVALEKNKTWELMDLFDGKNLVRCRWVFTIKYKANGTLERYKTSLVVKGYIVKHMGLVILKLFHLMKK